MNKNELTKVIIGITIFILIIGTGWLYRNTAEIITVKITDKIVKMDKSGDSVTSTYMIFTENETFKNTDSLLFWKFNSSDVYGKLQKGKTYNVRVVGWRISFLSRYRNIIEIKNQVESKKEKGLQK